MSSQPLHVNGKWLSQRLTGTQRYAGQMVEAIARTSRVPLILHVPADGDVPDWARHLGLDIRQSRWRGLFFEQVTLPWASRGKLLLNFAGPAPLVKFNQLVTMHDATPFRYPKTFRRAFVWFYFIMYFVLGRTARQLLTVSQFSVGELAQVLHIPENRFEVAPCAADALTSVEANKPSIVVPHDFYVVVGTQARHKNLLEPVKAVARSGRSVVIVGLAGDRRVFSGGSSLETHAVVAGRLSDAELVWLYQNARALVFPSKYEGFGLPPLEAQVLGCAVITSMATAMPEVCGDGALFFDPDDPTTLLDQLDRFEGDSLLADSIRRKGARNSERFTWDKSAVVVLDRLGVGLP